MRFYWILVAIAFLFSACQDLELSEPEEEWLRVYGSCMTDDDSGQLQVVDFQASDDNAFFLVGTYFSAIDNSDLDSCWIVKTDASGYQIWSRTYQASEILPYPKRMKINSAGNLVILSNSVANVNEVNTSEMQLVEINSSGDVIRDKRFEITRSNAYFGNDFALAPDNDEVWIVGSTTEIIDPNQVVGDVIDSYLVQLDAGWNILRTYIDGTVAADLGLTVNIRGNQVLMQSSEEETAFGSDRIHSLLLNRNTGVTIDSFSTPNEKQVYPREVLFTDDSTWLVLYTPINLLSNEYLLRRFQSRMLQSEFQFDNSSKPLSMELLAGQDNELILVGQENGAGQTWTMSNINNLNTSTPVSGESFGIESVSTYSVEFEKSIILDQSEKYIYIIGNQERPTNNTNSANICETVVFLRLRL